MRCCAHSLDTYSPISFFGCGSGHGTSGLRLAEPGIGLGAPAPALAATCLVPSLAFLRLAVGAVLFIRRQIGKPRSGFVQLGGSLLQPSPGKRRQPAPTSSRGSPKGQAGRGAASVSASRPAASPETGHGGPCGQAEGDAAPLPPPGRLPESGACGHRVPTCSRRQWQGCGDVACF